MSRFYLGQRVKKVRGQQGVGMTGYVVAFDALADFGCQVAFDQGGPALVGPYEVRIPAGVPAWCRVGDLEPILPEGHQPSEFASVADLLDSFEVTA